MSRLGRWQWCVLTNNVVDDIIGPLHLQHDDLMPERNDLGLRRRLSAQSKKGIEHHQYKDGHGRSRLTMARLNFNNPNDDEVFSNDNRRRLRHECEFAMHRSRAHEREDERLPLA